MFILLVVIAVVLAVKISHANLKLAKSQPGLYSVNHFVDGDTIALNMNGTVESVRFIGVDTPETHRLNTPVQCYGPEASDYVKRLIGNQRVRLQADPLDTNRDVYGRLLRYIYLPDGALVEQKLIQNGYGFAYTYFPFSKVDEFKAYEAQAKAAGRGLWSACQVTVEANGKEQTNALAQ